MGRESECDGKTKYRTKGKAIERMLYQMENRKRTKRKRGYGRHVKMETYHCPHCGWWHVGSTIDRKVLRARELRQRGIDAIDRALIPFVRHQNRV